MDDINELFQEKWTEIKETVRREYNLSDISYHTWVEPLEFYSVEGDIVNIIIPDDKSNMLNYITSKYEIFFQVTITEMFDHDYNVAFILKNDIVQDVSENETIHNPSYNINYENANLNPKYKFDTFVVGSNNRFAHAGSLAVAESPGVTYNPLYLYGGPGLGKTHLMHSIGHFILENNPDMKVLYVTSEVFTNEVIESIRSGNAASMTKLREKYRTVDVLMVDDVQFIIGKESTQEEFFHTFNVLHNAGKQIVLSSDKPPKEMETLDERFRSRFEWGLIADINPPDYETRMAILRKNAEIYERKIDDEVINYIATNVKSNIRELEGALRKVIANARLNNAELNLALAEDSLKDIIYPDAPKQITPEFILKIVADHYNVSENDITSGQRNADVVLPRQVFMYLCREYCNVPLVNIAKYVGKKDHTTVMHGYNKIKSELEHDEILQNNINIIIKKINPS